MDLKTIRFVAYREDKDYVGQGLECDITVHAPHLAGILGEIRDVMASESLILEHIPPAPTKFFTLFEEEWRHECVHGLLTYNIERKDFDLIRINPPFTMADDPLTPKRSSGT